MVCDEFPAGGVGRTLIAVGLLVVCDEFPAGGVGRALIAVGLWCGEGARAVHVSRPASGRMTLSTTPTPVSAITAASHSVPPAPPPVRGSAVLPDVVVGATADGVIGVVVGDDAGEVVGGEVAGGPEVVVTGAVLEGGVDVEDATKTISGEVVGPSEGRTAHELFPQEFGPGGPIAWHFLVWLCAKVESVSSDCLLVVTQSRAWWLLPPCAP